MRIEQSKVLNHFRNGGLVGPVKSIKASSTSKFHLFKANSYAAVCLCQFRHCLPYVCAFILGSV